MSIIDRFLSLLAPYECLVCAGEGALLCGPCLARLPGVPEECYRCQTPSPHGMSCPRCLQIAGLERVSAVTPYKGAAKELVGRLKFSGAKEAARTMARSFSLPYETSSTRSHIVVIPVPTATGRVRQRGFDQAKLLARELCRRQRLDYADCLSRHGQARQLGQSRGRRLEQLEGVFRVSNAGRLGGKHVVLMDDVMTTGATLEAAAAAVKRAGARRISAMIFARA